MLLRPVLLLAFATCNFVGSLSAASTVDPYRIRAISLDITGTLLATREPVVKSYHDAARWARLSHVPSQDELKRGFGATYKERNLESPCFGGVEGISGREWWRETVRRVLLHANPERTYTDEEFDRYFQRVYQHFGGPLGYEVLGDAERFLDAMEASGSEVLLGITSNTPLRHIDSVLPLVGIHDRFRWFTCSQEVGREKPSWDIFESSFRKARFWAPDLSKDEVLHVGDSYECDYCGAKRYGFQALLLDRSGNPQVTKYQDWVEGPDYDGKSPEEVQSNTITGLDEVAELLLNVSPA
mmetsp:Transcript_18208/g.42472  ORF Transcript_18208/g.42472 Transcript_18208/m.42472 type:complete len:298 (+) Transcript_18208:52-945(+)